MFNVFTVLWPDTTAKTLNKKKVCGNQSKVELEKQYQTAQTDTFYTVLYAFNSFNHKY